MSRETSTVSEPSRGRRALLMLGMLGLLGVLALAAGWVYVKSRADLTGLEGTWRQQGDASHTFRFKANGNVDAWYQVPIMAVRLLTAWHPRDTHCDPNELLFTELRYSRPAGVALAVARDRKTALPKQG